MLMAVDIGNTETSWGVFEGDRLTARWSTSTVIERTADEYRVLLSSLLAERGFSRGDITHAAMCSVVPPLTGIFEELLGGTLAVKPLVVGAGIKTGIRIRMDNPREVGADRIVNAVAAHDIYSGAVIIIDMGTATTFDTISADGDYLGGAIAPGLKTSIESLYAHTAMLPRIDLTRPEKAIGTNTVTAMRSGLIFGYAGLIEGLIKRIKNELGQQASVVATGGLANIIAGEVKSIDDVRPDLTLTGLKLLHKLNLE